MEQISASASRGLESISETLKETAINGTKESPLLAGFKSIENSSLEQLKAQNSTRIAEIDGIYPAKSEGAIKNECNRLTDEEKKKIKNEKGWSDEIINQISSMKEYEIYSNAGLQEVDVGGKKCLVRSDIDWDQKDSMGRTNKERAESGLAPIYKDGQAIELHHIGQKKDGCLAELTPDEHRSKENYSVLHTVTKPSEIDRVAFNNERSDHWQSRANAGGQNA